MRKLPKRGGVRWTNTARSTGRVGGFRLAHPPTAHLVLASLLTCLCYTRHLIPNKPPPWQQPKLIPPPNPDARPRGYPQASTGVRGAAAYASIGRPATSAAAPRTPRHRRCSLSARAAKPGARSSRSPGGATAKPGASSRTDTPARDRAPLPRIPLCCIQATPLDAIIPSFGIPLAAKHLSRSPGEAPAKPRARGGEGPGPSTAVASLTPPPAAGHPTRRRHRRHRAALPRGLPRSGDS